jgi:glycerol-1-phosphate dehydrogenase [NAD(P)+]
MPMTLRFDPGDIETFKEDIRRLPGYPAGEELPIRQMVFEADALYRLPALLQEAGALPGQAVTVVMDTTPMRRGAADLKPLVLAQLSDAGWPAQPIWLEPDESGQVHADMRQVGRVQALLRPQTVVLSVGSGTVTDVAKHAAHLYQQKSAAAPLPFVCFQTANSVNAFTSRTASVFVDGVKRTLASRYVDVLVCDLETLRAAPPVLTAAGVGDVVAALSSLADWHLQHRLGLDPTYTEFSDTLMGPLDEILLGHAEAIRARSLEGMEVLAKLLTLGGLAMSLSHATAPMSGVEHGVSHLLDSLATLNRRPLALHGLQVGLASILTTEAFRILVEEFDPAELDPARCYPEREAMRKRLTTALDSMDPTGRASAECWPEFEAKLLAWNAARADFAAALRDWPAVRAGVQARARPPETVAEILRAVGAPLDLAQLEPPKEPAQLKFAFSNASFVRRRPMLCDLLLFMNWNPEALWARAWQKYEKLAAP